MSHVTGHHFQGQKVNLQGAWHIVAAFRTAHYVYFFKYSLAVSEYSTDICSYSKYCKCVFLQGLSFAQFSFK